MADETYPVYPGNPQDESLDIVGDDTVANAGDYNQHDREILAHQDALAGIQVGTQVFPNLKLANGGKFFLDESENTYFQFNITTNKIEIYINGVKAGNIAVSL